MMKLKFTYKVSNIESNNINLILLRDFNFVKTIGTQFKSCSFDFKNNIRILHYVCKNKNIVNSLIRKAKNSKIKDLRWKFYVV